MAELQKVLDQVISGAMTAEDAAPKVATICKAQRDGDDDSLTKDSTMEDAVRASMGDKDPTDSFMQVTAAWIGGQITDEQYKTIRGAVVPS